MQGSPLCFKTVKRQGSAYLCEKSNNDGFDSAMAIRKMLFEGKTDELETRLPKRSFEVLKTAKQKGEIFDPDKYTDAATMYFRLLNNTTDEPFAECEGGVLERICKIANETSENNRFWELLSTKRYTDSKLRRAVLFAMCNVRKSDIKALPSYTVLLAASECGRVMLNDRRRSSEMLVITKPADVFDVCGESAQRQRELGVKLASIYNFCLEKSAPTGESMKKKPYIT